MFIHWLLIVGVFFIVVDAGAQPKQAGLEAHVPVEICQHPIHKTHQEAGQGHRQQQRCKQPEQDRGEQFFRQRIQP